MFEKAIETITGKETTKETLEVLEGISNNFVHEFKKTAKISKKLKSAVKNCQAINKELMNAIIESDVLNRNDAKIVNSSYYLTLKNLEIARNYQRHAYSKLSQIPDIEQMGKLISDAIEYLNLSFGFIVKALKFLKGARKF